MKTVIEMAREAGLRDCTCAGTKGCLERFAALVAADEQKKWQDQTMVDIHEAVLDEREACAKVCDEQYQHLGPEYGEVRYGIAACATAIRERSANAGARGQQDPKCFNCNWRQS